MDKDIMLLVFTAFTVFLVWAMTRKKKPKPEEVVIDSETFDSDVLLAINTIHTYTYHIREDGLLAGIAYDEISKELTPLLEKYGYTNNINAILVSLGRIALEGIKRLDEINHDVTLNEKEREKARKIEYKFFGHLTAVVDRARDIYKENQMTNEM